MAAALPLNATGRHIYGCIITPLYPNPSTGTLVTVTAGSAQLYGTLKEVRLEQMSDDENISAMNRTAPNPIPIEYNARVELTQHEVHSGTNWLASFRNMVTTLTTVIDGTAAAFVHPIDHFKIKLIRGGQNWIFYGKMENYSMDAPKRHIDGKAVFVAFDAGDTDFITYG